MHTHCTCCGRNVFHCLPAPVLPAFGEGVVTLTKVDSHSTFAALWSILLENTEDSWLKNFSCCLNVCFLPQNVEDVTISLVLLWFMVERSIRNTLAACCWSDYFKTFSFKAQWYWQKDPHLSCSSQRRTVWKGLSSPNFIGSSTSQ